MECSFSRNCILGSFSLITRRQTSGHGGNVCLLLLQTSNRLMQTQRFQFPFQFHSYNSELKISQWSTSFLHTSSSKYWINIRFEEPFVCAKDWCRNVFANLLRAIMTNARSLLHHEHRGLLKVYGARGRRGLAQNQPPGHLYFIAC